LGLDRLHVALCFGLCGVTIAHRSNAGDAATVCVPCPENRCSVTLKISGIGPLAGNADAIHNEHVLVSNDDRINYECAPVTLYGGGLERSVISLKFDEAQVSSGSILNSLIVLLAGSKGNEKEKAEGVFHRTKMRGVAPLSAATSRERAAGSSDRVAEIPFGIHLVPLDPTRA